MLSFMLEENSLEAPGAYQKAFEYSQKKFINKNPIEMASNSGGTYDSNNSTITLPSLGQSLDIHFPNGHVYFSGTKKKPLWQWRLIILNYLSRAGKIPLSQEIISFRELENGQIFYPAFEKYAINTLSVKLANFELEKIKKACLNLGATLEEKADLCAIFKFLPYFPVTVKLWLADEEMAGAANILFGSTANHYLHTEDIAATGELIVDFLVKSLRSPHF